MSQSFNPISEPTDDWECKLDRSPEQQCREMNLETDQKTHLATSCSGTFSDGDKNFSFPCGPSLSEDDDELTESKIKAFLDEKVCFRLESRKITNTLPGPIYGFCMWIFIHLLYFQADTCKNVW